MMLFLKLFKSTYLFSVLFLIFGMTVYGQSKNNSIEVGAERFELYVPLLEGKKVGIVGNHTSIIVKENNSTNFTHLADTLISLKIEVKKLFSPEHGFRGSADAGELIVDGKDTKTGLRSEERRVGKECPM
jgi:uncharacterized protein YbbC (DUF1343 family)